MSPPKNWSLDQFGRASRKMQNSKRSKEADEADVGSPAREASSSMGRHSNGSGAFGCYLLWLRAPGVPTGPRGGSVGWGWNMRRLRHFHQTLHYLVKSLAAGWCLALSGASEADAVASVPDVVHSGPFLHGIGTWAVEMGVSLIARFSPERHSAPSPSKPSKPPTHCHCHIPIWAA